MCIFLLQIIIHIQVVTETEEDWWVMEGTVCAEDYTFYGKINYLLRTGFFIHHNTVKRDELVSDRMSHIVMRGCR
jgi:hypothetical protein